MDHFKCRCQPADAHWSAQRGIELADELSPRRIQLGYFQQSPNRFPTGSTTSAVFPFAQRPLGHKVQNAARVVVARNQRFVRWNIYFQHLMDDDFHYRGVS